MCGPLAVPRRCLFRLLMHIFLAAPQISLSLLTRLSHRIAPLTAPPPRPLTLSFPLPSHAPPAFQPRSVISPRRTNLYFSSASHAQRDAADEKKEPPPAQLAEWSDARARFIVRSEVEPALDYAMVRVASPPRLRRIGLWLLTCAH